MQILFEFSNIFQFISTAILNPDVDLTHRHPLRAIVRLTGSWGYTSAADKQRLEATVRRAIRLGLYTADDLTPSQLAADMDGNLLANILNNPCHVLYKLLPNNTEHTYNLR